ncbi:hypothetical protein HKK52_21235 [Pseudomonas sp. ADAK2]|uniref:hypothetical protein n=1 Tax=unclassified Pseudomonas TaxID=196821 RepID=UPI001464719E|nr:MULTISPECIES: hypothetical protein [unclassified Pseudomonas]QJI43369.1 hypothetical protein HKK53_21240 [Pseudomonas sp. ADAK7]QJI49672.1 hypothetical protein HKK52_21235 [Pseudomonas sp. ADAK2]
MNTPSRILISVLIHSLGCLAYAILNDAVVHAYKAFNGGFTTRGVAIGGASHALFYIFVTVNLIVALIPNLLAKLLLLSVMVGFILLWMMPENPLRALFYGVAQGSVTFMAILTTQVIELRWAQRLWNRRTGQTPSAGVRQ